MPETQTQYTDEPQPTQGFTEPGETLLFLPERLLSSPTSICSSLEVHVGRRED